MKIPRYIIIIGLTGMFFLGYWLVGLAGSALAVFLTALVIIMRNDFYE